MSELTPLNFIGGDFHNMAGLSSWGRLYRISRLNGLTIGQTISALGVPDDVAIPIRTLQFFPVDQIYRVLDNLQGHARTRAWPALAGIIPYQVESHKISSAIKQMRACPTCLKHGYHSIVHLMSWIHHCPWHNEALIERCVCGGSLTQAPPSSRMMICYCGHDHYDRLMGLASLTTWPEHEVIDCISDVLDQAKFNRSTHRLFNGNSCDLYESIGALRADHGSFPDLLRTQVSDEEIAGADNALMKKIVLKWDECSHSLGSESVPIAQQHAALNDLFKRVLAEKIAYSLEAVTGYPRGLINFENLFGASGETEHGVIRAKFLCSGSWKVGNDLIRRFINKGCSVNSDELALDKRNANLHSALDQYGEKTNLLGLTLSAIAMQADVSRWTMRMWRIFAGVLPQCPYWSGETIVASQLVGNTFSTICRDMRVSPNSWVSSEGSKTFLHLVGEAITEVGLQSPT